MDSTCCTSRDTTPSVSSSPRRTSSPRCSSKKATARTAFSFITDVGAVFIPTATLNKTKATVSRDGRASASSVRNAFWIKKVCPVHSRVSSRRRVRGSTRRQSGQWRLRRSRTSGGSIWSRRTLSMHFIVVLGVSKELRTTTRSDAQASKNFETPIRSTWWFVAKRVILSLCLTTIAMKSLGPEQPHLPRHLIL
ncbi:hypothetical protein MSAN_01337400 [Mycena sanguinolenta]|uniref:Uncharacterized protein n=1 Tax=Mycena sanguinolenta TaxID=230812 RepID=A0A8H7D0H8_9AGAR|nr:hypothetical protein MSAN_01337400 [Mycena sanguinolenta]